MWGNDAREINNIMACRKIRLDIGALSKEKLYDVMLLVCAVLSRQSMTFKRNSEWFAEPANLARFLPRDLLKEK